MGVVAQAERTLDVVVLADRDRSVEAEGARSCGRGQEGQSIAIPLRDVVLADARLLADAEQFPLALFSHVAALGAVLVLRANRDEPGADHIVRETKDILIRGLEEPVCPVLAEEAVPEPCRPRPGRYAHRRVERAPFHPERFGFDDE